MAVAQVTLCGDMSNVKGTENDQNEHVYIAGAVDVAVGIDKQHAATRLAEIIELLALTTNVFSPTPTTPGRSPG